MMSLNFLYLNNFRLYISQKYIQRTIYFVLIRAATNLNISVKKNWVDQCLRKLTDKRPKFLNTIESNKIHLAKFTSVLEFGIDLHSLDCQS